MSALRAVEAPGTGPLAVRISPMRRRHLAAVLRIERQVYPCPWTLGLYLGELALPSSRIYLVARIGHRVVGYGGLMSNYDEGHVTTLAVDPNHQGQQLGTRLLLQLAARALERGARSLTLEVRMSNETAKNLYRKFGFGPAGVRKNYYPEVNEDALVMWAHDVDGDAYRERLAAIEADLRSPTVVEP